MSVNELREDEVSVDALGRVLIPGPVRKKIGAIPGSLATITVVVGGEERTFTRKVLPKGRVVIPEGIREGYDIEEGDVVDLKFPAEDRSR